MLQGTQRRRQSGGADAAKAPVTEANSANTMQGTRRRWRRGRRWWRACWRSRHGCSSRASTSAW